MGALDFAWARYTVALGERRLAAANWALLLFALGAVVTRTYVEHEWTIVPAGLGAWAGTYAGGKVRR